jgi:hypothetical protein
LLAQSKEVLILALTVVVHHPVTQKAAKLMNKWFRLEKSLSEEEYGLKDKPERSSTICISLSER